MKPLAVSEICAAVRGRWLRRSEDRVVGAVDTDSRTAREGSLFVALSGERFDGHAFLDRAVEAGCVAAIVQWDHELSDELAARFSGGVIGVADTTRALGDLAAYHRGMSPATVIAVTGSNGKTTVKRMIHHILSRRLTGTSAPASFNNQIGVPLTLLAAGGGDDYVVCELGTSAPGEIAALAKLARPDVAVITSVAAAHLQGLGSIERVAVEKASLLGSLADDGLAVINADSDLLGRAVRHCQKRVIRFGVSDSAELRLTGYEPCGRGQRFEINGRLRVRMPLCGRHNALNALAAIIVARRLGLTDEQAAAALEDFDGAEMRLEWIDAGAVTILNDAYNANPGSVAAAADVLAEMPGKRKVIVLGDMLELGDEAEELHRLTGLEIAAREIDLVIGVGALGRYISAGAAEAAGDGMRTETFDTIEDAAGDLPAMLREGDVVLLKGSRATGMDRLVEPIRSAFTAPPGRKTKKGPGSKTACPG